MFSFVYSLNVKCIGLHIFSEVIENQISEMNEAKEVSMHRVHGVCEAVLLSIAATTSETPTEIARASERERYDYATSRVHVFPQAEMLHMRLSGQVKCDG